MHPYRSYQDGRGTTYRVTIFYSQTLGTVPYTWQVLHVGDDDSKTFRTKWCHGQSGEVVCDQIGEDFVSTTHDSYHYATVGFESPEGMAVLNQTMDWDQVHYQRDNGTWYGFCPYFVTGSGYPGAALTSCHINPNNTYDFTITTFGTAFFTSIGGGS
jgi:hypothetical protein